MPVSQIIRTYSTRDGVGEQMLMVKDDPHMLPPTAVLIWKFLRRVGIKHSLTVFRSAQCGEWAPSPFPLCGGYERRADSRSCTASRARRAANRQNYKWLFRPVKCNCTSNKIVKGVCDHHLPLRPQSQHSISIVYPYRTSQRGPCDHPAAHPGRLRIVFQAKMPKKS